MKRHRPAKVQYKLRLGILRQRYWGEPIPIVKCDKCSLWLCRRIIRLSCR
ncbi:MAG: hypothetical protein ACLS69_01765 [Butyricicoccus sp.]